MKHVLCAILCLCGWGAAHAQTVSDVDCYQNGKQIVVTYTLDKAADISVYCSTDGGQTYGPALQRVAGDVGRGVEPGRKKIVWDVLAEVESLTGDRIVFKVVPVGGFFCEMVFVEGGTFTMGATAEQEADAFDSEKPAHRVTVSDFYIGKYEVTQAQWKAVMGNNPSNWKGDDLPVECVSWYDVQTFVRKLNAQTGERYRLPTEAEWEYAARGGNKSRGYKYSGGNDIGSVAWYDGNSGSRTHPVGQKAPNELGLYDMSGNVWEWCQDWYGPYDSSSQTDPTGPSTGSYRVLRGGGWHYGALGCRVSFRDYNSPGSWGSGSGLRLVAY